MMQPLSSCAAPSTSPLMLTFSNISDSSFHLTWQGLPPADQNGIIRHYIVNITEMDTGRQFQLTSLATYISVRSLHPFYTYVCTVAASTVDIGPYSPPLTVRTLEAGMVLGSQQLMYFHFIQLFYVHNGQLVRKGKKLEPQTWDK